MMNHSVHVYGGVDGLKHRGLSGDLLNLKWRLFLR